MIHGELVTDSSGDCCDQGGYCLATHQGRDHHPCDSAAERTGQNHDENASGHRTAFAHPRTSPVPTATIEITEIFVLHSPNRPAPVQCPERCIPMSCSACQLC